MLCLVRRVRGVLRLLRLGGERIPGFARTGRRRRRKLDDFDLRLLAREEDDSSSVTEHHSRTDILGVEDIFNGQRVGAMTRDEMALFLLRAKEGSGYAPPACTTPMFADVPCSNSYAPWSNELVRRGVTAGCGRGH